MANQLIPPPEMRTRSDIPKTPEERVAAWFELLGFCEQFLLAGLRAKIGPDGDLKAAYRDWYEREWELKDRQRKRRLEELQRRREGHAP